MFVAFFGQKAKKSAKWRTHKQGSHHMFFSRMSHLQENKVRKRRKYDKDSLRKAYEATQNGMSVYRAAKEYKVPEMTLRDRVKGRVAMDTKCGGDTLFTPQEEQTLVDHIMHMSKIGYSYTKQKIQHVGVDYAKYLKKRPKRTKTLSDNWFYRLHKNFPNMIVKKPGKYSTPSESKLAIATYYDELFKILTTNGLNDAPERIYTIDEVDVNWEDTVNDIEKDSECDSVENQKRESVTLIAGANASGKCIPPYYVFFGKRWNNNLLMGGIVGSNGRMLQSCNSNTEILESYIKNHLSRHANIQICNKKPSILVLYDGHKYHLALTLSKWATGRNVILFVLPPKHATIPSHLDSFVSFTKQCNTECNHYMETHPHESISKYNIAKLTAEPYRKSFSPENITTVFMHTGIYPFCRIELCDTTKELYDVKNRKAEVDNMSDEEENPRGDDDDDLNM